MTTKERKEFIVGLRQLAKLLETWPELPTPPELYCTAYLTGDEFRAAQQHLGSYTKEPHGDIYGIERKLPGKVVYRLITARENVCAKRVVGTRIMPEHTEEIVEWDCGAILDQAAG